MGSIHVTQPAPKPDVKDKTCFNCGKKGHLAENCPEPKKCSHCGKKGHVAKDCWEKHPDKKPKAKGKAQPSKPFGKFFFLNRWLQRISRILAVLGYEGIKQATPVVLRPKRKSSAHSL